MGGIVPPGFPALRPAFHEGIVVGDPAEQSCRVVLGHAGPVFVGPDGDIAVKQDGGGKEYGREWGELNRHPQVPEDEMPAQLVVVVSQASHSAP